MTSVRTVLPLLLLATFIFSAPPLQAGSNASTNLDVTNFTITPSAGSVMFSSPWTAEAFASAQDSSDPSKQQFNSSFGKLAQAGAATLFASGQASSDPISLLSSSASASFGQPSGYMVASGVAKSMIFDSTFEITGGTGPVNVNFSALLNGLQSLTTTGGGIDAISSVIFDISINGKDVVSLDSYKQIFKNSSLLNPISTAINGGIVLQYGEQYTIEVDDILESKIYNTPSPAPEPSALSLLFGGPALIFARRWILAKRG